MAAPQYMKEALVICLDVGRSMWMKGSKSLDEARIALSLYVQQKVMDGKKTEQMGFILFGTEDTNNDLYDGQSPFYKHVTVFRNIEQPDIELIRAIENDIQGQNAEGDFVDALIVAVDMLGKHTAGKKFNKRIIMVTDAGSPCHPDQIEKIVEEMNSKEMKLQIFGLDFDNIDASENVKDASRKRKSETKMKNEAVIWTIQSICDEFELIPMKEALEQLSYFRSKNIRQTTLFRGVIDIAGDAMQIPVMVYTQTAEMKMPQFKSVFVNDAGEIVSVSRDTTYYTSDEANEEIEPDSVIKGYRYGKDLVPINPVDEQQMAMENERCLSVIGFAKQSEILREHYMSNVLCVAPQAGDPLAATALSSLIHSLYLLKSVAIVRYVWRKNAIPHIGFLSPHIKADYECLYYTQLPFAEDVREYSFASLSKLQPNDAQTEAMDNFINKLDLVTASRDLDNEPLEDLKPRNVPNVALHRIQEAIKLRALHPNSKIPELNPSLARLVERNKNLWEGAKNEIEQLENLFPVKKIEAATKRAVDLVWGAQTTPADGNDLASKRTKLGDDSLKSLAGEKVSVINSTDPVGDFKKMIHRRDMDMVEEAFSQLKKMVINIVDSSFMNQNFEKAIDCVKVMREEAIKEDEPKVFNDYLKELMDTYKDRKNGFWNEIQSVNKITLISNAECDESDISPEEAAQFLDAKQVQVSLPTPVVQKTNDDDLFDMMD